MPERQKNRPTLFRALAQALTPSDVRVIFSAILSATPDQLDAIERDYPCFLTTSIINKLRQDSKGYLYAAGSEERKQSIETIKFMLERCFGKAPLQIEVTEMNGSSRVEELKQRLMVETVVSGDVQEIANV